MTYLAYLILIFGTGKEMASEPRHLYPKYEGGSSDAQSKVYFLYLISSKSSNYSRSKARLFSLAESPIG